MTDTQALASTQLTARQDDRQGAVKPKRTMPVLTEEQKAARNAKSIATRKAKRELALQQKKEDKGEIGNMVAQMKSMQQMQLEMGQRMAEILGRKPKVAKHIDAPAAGAAGESKQEKIEINKFDRLYKYIERKLQEDATLGQSPAAGAVASTQLTARQDDRQGAAQPKVEAQHPTTPVAPKVEPATKVEPKVEAPAPKVEPVAPLVLEAPAPIQVAPIQKPQSKRIKQIIGPK